MFSYDIKIPKDRVAVLIGEKGVTKRIIQRETKTKITVDSKEGDVNIAGEDGVLLFAAQQIVAAIARGFNPEAALRLLKPDWAYEQIDLTDYSTKKNHQLRMKGRVIGQGGKARQVIEDLSESTISIYGKTISIIAPVEYLNVAKRAVIMLLDGSNHSTVYRWLETKRRDIKREKILGMK